LCLNAEHDYCARHDLAKIHLSIGRLSVIVAVCKVIPVVMKICALVISTEGPQSGPKWRNLFKTDFSTPLCYARNDPNKRIYYI
jgi:hypothetical protein